MYFEATYLPSPQFSTESLDDSLVPDMLSPTEEALPPPQAVKEDQRHEEEEKEEEVSEETPVNHLVFVIHGIGQVGHIMHKSISTMIVLTQLSPFLFFNSKQNNMDTFMNMLKVYKKPPAKSYKPKSRTIMCVLN
ncbi:hypothetical protein BC941DRAFT_171497 [Chlamydoabsidia padenii]|nr:hypothetical protein BC941DRAFT_171497 [Chlamydoabsidia padenii]